MWHIQIISAFW